MTIADPAPAFFDSLQDGSCRSLHCRNVVGVLWERMYCKRDDGYYAMTAAPGCFNDWQHLTAAETLDSIRRTMAIIEQVRLEG